MEWRKDRVLSGTECRWHYKDHLVASGKHKAAKDAFVSFCTSLNPFMWCYSQEMATSKSSISNFPAIASSSSASIHHNSQHTHTHECTHIVRHVRTHMHENTFMHSHVYTHIHAHIRMHILLHSLTRASTHEHSCLHMYTLMYSHMHTQVTYTYTLTCIAHSLV